MQITYDKNELATDIRSLEGKGIETDVAKELAQFKRLIDCAAHTWESLSWAVDEESVPEEIFESFENAHANLEQAYYEVIELFPRK
jgi:hypothetical protein